MIALRQAGLEPVVASMGTALHRSAQLRELSSADQAAVPVLRRRRRRRGRRRSAGWSSRCAQGFEIPGRVASAGDRPGRRPPAALRPTSPRPSRTLFHRVRLELARAPRPAACVRPRSRRPQRASRSRRSGTRRGGFAGRQARPDGAAPERCERDDVLRAVPVSPKLLGGTSDSSRARSPACGRTRPLARVLAELGPGPLRRRAPSPRGRAPPRAGGAGRRAGTRSSPASTRSPSSRQSTRRRQSSSSSASASGSCSASSRTAGQRIACPTCSRPSRRSGHASASSPEGLGLQSAARLSPVAQLAEHPAVNRRVVGSSPTRGVSACLDMRKPHETVGQGCRNSRVCTDGAVPVLSRDLARQGNDGGRDADLR